MIAVKKRIPLNEAEEAGVTLGSLLGMEAADEKEAAETREEKRPDDDKKTAAADELKITKAVLQRTRAGRAGRWGVRVLLTPEPSPEQLKSLAKDLRKALGTGAQIDGGVITVQGDIADRIADWLTKRGAKKIVQ